MLNKGKLIGQGNTAEIYHYKKSQILKLYRRGIMRTLCVDEFNNIKILNKFTDMVPKAYGVVEDEDRVGIVYEKIEGKTMLKKIMLRLFSFKKYAKKLANYHIDIQKDVGDAEFRTVKEKLKRDIMAEKVLNDQEKYKVLEYLKSLPDGSNLCHFDFHPDNIIIQRDEKPVVIDWMTACKGDSNADVARTVVLLNYGMVNTKSMFIRKITNLFKKKLCKYYLNEYILVTKKDVKDIEKWFLPVMAARLVEFISKDEKDLLENLVKEKLSQLEK